MKEHNKELESELKKRHIERLERAAKLEHLDYTFDMPLEGNGWHTRETNRELFWRFTGPSQKATIYFPKILAKERELKLHIFHAITPKHIDELTVKYNDWELKKTTQKTNTLIFHIPSAAISSKEYVLIEFSTPPTVRPLDHDDRNLGISLSRIEIY
jgi:hypothetical protein